MKSYGNDKGVPLLILMTSVIRSQKVHRNGKGMVLLIPISLHKGQKVLAREGSSSFQYPYSEVRKYIEITKE